MPELTIDYDETEGFLVLSGSVDRLLRDPTVSLFIRRFGGKQESDSCIKIPVEVEEVDSRYQSLSKLILRQGLSVAEDDHLSETMQEVKRLESEFQDFSLHAAAIWNAEFDTDDFANFVKRVEKGCPGRNFYRLQLLSAYHLAFSQHVCNFSVPGSGKTSIVYAAFAFLNSLDRDDPKFVDHILVVGPLSAFKVWEEEYAEIFLCEPRSKRLAGFMSPTEREAYLRGITLEARDRILTMTSYATLANNRVDFAQFLSAGSRRVMMVLDEAHYIKSSDGIWANAAISLSRYASSRVVLTGTPVPNGYEDLSNLFRFIYSNRDIIGFSGVALKAMTEGKMGRDASMRLKEKIRPYFTRIKKRDLELPPIENNVVVVDMESKQETIYRYIEDIIVPKFEEQLNDVGSILNRARLIRLRQAATNPSLLLKPLVEEGFLETGTDHFSISDSHILDLISGFRPAMDLAKLIELQRLIQFLKEKHDKILIWSIFINNLHLLERTLEGAADDIDVIYGATPVESDLEGSSADEIETREKIITRFKESDGFSILIANPQAIGESISLHKSCHVAIYFDRDFNAGRFIQSKDRIHRYGLSEGQITEYYFLISGGTVENDINTRLAIKEERLQQLVEADEIPLFRIALGDDEYRQDIRAVIERYESRKLVTTNVPASTR